MRDVPMGQTQIDRTLDRYRHQVLVSMCVCGGRLTAEMRGIPDAMRRHQATHEHRAWWRRCGWDQ